MNPYEIIATLGPASRSPELWSELLAGGATGFRLNTSHLSLPALEEWLADLEPFLTGQAQVRVTFDLQGSKWRLGQFEPFALEAGTAVRLVLAGGTDERCVLPVPHPDLFAAAGVGAELTLDDAKLRLRVVEADKGELAARVEQGGPVRPRKGITCPGADTRVERLGEQDQAVYERTRGLAWVGYAISYLRDAAEMRRYRELFGPRAHLAAKLERRSAMAAAAEIAGEADSVWICRGDLGAEAGMAGMAELVAQVTSQVRAGVLPAPVIMAGQVLEHLTAHSSPTRAEVCNLFDSLSSGCAGVVLSDETAVGVDPVNAVRQAGMFGRET